MKTIVVSVVLFFGSMLGTGIAQAQENQPKDSARIIFMRTPSYLGAANLFKVKLANGSIVKLVNGSYYELTVPAGVFEYTQSSSKSFYKMEVVAGRTYYIRASFVSGVWTLGRELMTGDSVWGGNVMRGGSLKNMRKPLLRPLNRVGVVFNAGFGFNDIAIVKTTDGSESSMGFAGGAGVSVQVGREVDKHIDIAASYSYMNRGLTTYVKNGTIDFSRHFISVTPSFIIPIQGGYGQRIKIGGGVDFYMSNKLTVKTKGIPGGFEDTWKYGQAVGFHAQLMYEVNMSDRVSIVSGVRYYSVAYSFESGGLYLPTDDQLAKPNGDGLDLRIGFNYLFY